MKQKYKHLLWHPYCSFWRPLPFQHSISGTDIVQKPRKGNPTNTGLGSELRRVKVAVQKLKSFGFRNWTAPQRVLAGGKEAAIPCAASGKCRNSSSVISSQPQQILVGHQHCRKTTSITAHEGKSCKGAHALCNTWDFTSMKAHLKLITIC